jgi:hypothetical protein
VRKAGSKVQVVWDWKLFVISTKRLKKDCTVGGGGGGGGGGCCCCCCFCQYTFTAKYLQCFPLLLPGPFKINACPLRRISQNFVIATSTKLDISGVKLPANINDKYFKRSKQKRAKKVEGDIFSTKKEVRENISHSLLVFKCV